MFQIMTNIMVTINIYLRFVLMHVLYFILFNCTRIIHFFLHWKTGIFKEAVSLLGGLDILINNVDLINENDIMKAIDVNVVSIYNYFITRYYSCICLTRNYDYGFIRPLLFVELYLVSSKWEKILVVKVELLSMSRQLLAWNLLHNFQFIPQQNKQLLALVVHLQ